ncbi:hypothetical protein CK203_023420 [Vitis vinifera]|uniref:Uncharacterized protein n=1 Tax=Vitis vinifera TaxID=29760 RepID=A0A438J6M2_VITVI|nr:hypothetical protein CK203_023420 [Vitis vinifera]
MQGVVVQALASPVTPKAVINYIHEGGFDVRRILVDLGSSIDLLQMSTYKQMSYSSSALENTGRLLSEFNGATTTSLGDVLLPIQVGSITLKVRFSMVNDLSSYNAIMERA